MAFLSITNIGQKLKELRKAAGLSQEEMANKQGVDKNTVSNWERNITDIKMRAFLKYEELARQAIERENASKIKSSLSTRRGKA